MKRALLLAVLAAFVLLGRSIADPIALGALSRTNTVYTASQVDVMFAETDVTNVLSGRSFDFATNEGLYLAVSNLVTVLGGSVTNFPSLSIQ